MPPQPTPVFHITHWENLPSILQAGGLAAKNLLARGGITCRSIAFPSVQDRRSRTTVPCGPGGTLHDYVPFFFAARSAPFAYALSSARTPRTHTHSGQRQ